MRRLHLLLPAAALLLSGCVIVTPSTQVSYDSACQMERKRMTLDTRRITDLQSCGGQACTEQALATIAGVAVSGIVSGSVALVGNTVYWLQEQGKCNRPGSAAPVATPAPAGPGTPS
jgi:hypothetical protein